MSFSSLKSDIGEEREEQEGNQKLFPMSVREDLSLKESYACNPSFQNNNHEPYLNVPLQSAFARSSDTLSDLSTYSADIENGRRIGRMSTGSPSRLLLSASPAPSPRTRKESIRLFWTKYKGLTLVILSQLFGVMMNVTIRLLEASGTSGPEMHPFQVRPAVPLISLSDMLGAGLTMTDPIRSNDRDPYPKQHLSVVGSD